MCKCTVAVLVYGKVINSLWLFYADLAEIKIPSQFVCYRDGRGHKHNHQPLLLTAVVNYH